jgi:hypothetical protein
MRHAGHCRRRRDLRKYGEQLGGGVAASLRPARLHNLRLATMNAQTDVARLSAAAQALVAIETPQDAQRTMRLADLARVYARKMALGADAENAATAIRLKAEIRLAETVTEGQASGEIAGQGKPPQLGGLAAATLQELGVDDRRLSEARTIAEAFTLPAIDGLAEEASERGVSLSRAAVLREARHEASDRFDHMADALVDQATHDRQAFDKAGGALHAALDAIESVGRPVTEDEARPLLPTLTRLQQKLHGKHNARLEVVS